MAWRLFLHITSSLEAMCPLASGGEGWEERKERCQDNGVPWPNLLLHGGELVLQSPQLSRVPTLQLLRGGGNGSKYKRMPSEDGRRHR